MVLKKAPIILLRGGAGAGKDTAGRWIQNTIPGVQLLALADPIKELTYMVFEPPADCIWGASALRSSPLPNEWYGEDAWRLAESRLERLAPWWSSRVLSTYHGSPAQRQLVDATREWLVAMRIEALETGHLTYRRLLQTLGTDYGRALDADIWARCALRSAQRSVKVFWRLVVVTDGRFDNETEVFQWDGADMWLIERGAQLTGDEATHSSESEVYSTQAYRTADKVLNNKTSIHKFQQLLTAEVDDFLLVRGMKG